ncbi:MAG: UDP-N-acetyl-D-glucosamine 2-epimerase, UDP-hydrolysing [Bacteroidetes bacterium GWF2_33_16]|nr:MAG: UDP-N-acetyl-D-glucosamine 2-epimerase, UDP-hydrolysing [Bacteroidetes bacterium GWE2_32_14]OFY03399.1 MAG: UDP-N-acetyl-D-glucosamine 2-epimerase, UDP-hydrolysing [Bacteroidetes bacterium GWF2_33_16]
MKIAFFTTTRAEFGVLYPLIKEIDNTSIIENLLFVGGTHLLKEHGDTIEEIKEQNIAINDTFDYISQGTNPYEILHSLAKETSELAKLFEKHEFDAVCVLGDRYELIPIIEAAILYRKYIIHIHGGEKSEGAIDEQIRHMITKAAHIHFSACDEYAKNIRKMGESAWRVFNTGALAVDNMLQIPKIPKQELFNELRLDPEKELVLMTYHPVTLEKELSPVDQMKNVFKALESFNSQVLITAPNMDVNRGEILNEIKLQVKNNSNYHFIESLGSLRYLNLIKHCKFVIGNSSSGIVEVPFFKIPTINIGNRQKGRIRHSSVIDTDYSTESIQKGIKKALNKNFLLSLQEMKYKFGNGNTAKKMVDILESITFDKKLLQKQLDFEC